MHCSGIHVRALALRLTRRSFDSLRVAQGKREHGGACLHIVTFRREGREKEEGRRKGEGYNH
eukprot:13461929-Alexandrium_andersonii.AAC.1